MRISRNNRTARFSSISAISDPSSIAPSTATAEGGQFALANYRHALTLARDGRAEAVCFTPFNKKAMRLAHPPYDDEISFSAGVVGIDGPAREFHELGGPWDRPAPPPISLA